MNLRDFQYLKAVQRPGHRQPILYGASSPDGPWFRLSKRETATYLSALLKTAQLPDTAS